MMVSTKGRYALRVMLDLAMQKQEEYVSLNDIAQLPCARCSRLRTAAQLPNLYDVEGPERHDRRLLWQDHSGRPRRTRSGRE